MTSENPGSPGHHEGLESLQKGKSNQKNKLEADALKYGLSVIDARELIVKPWDPDKVHYVRLPNHPVSRSWTKHARPWRDPSTFDVTYLDCDPLDPELPKILKEHHDDWHGIYISPPWSVWDTDGDVTKAKFGMEQFKKLTCLSKLSSNGLVFVWVPKLLLFKMMEHMATIGYYWVETATCAIKNEENLFYGLPGPSYFNVGKENLQMFRRVDKSVYLEIRHQRTPDTTWVAGPFRRPDDYMTRLIETILPHETKFLHLWAHDADAEPTRHWVRVDPTRKSRGVAPTM